MIDITAFVDQEHFAVEVTSLMPEVFAAYLVAKDLAAAANPIAVATVQAEIESVASIAAVEPVTVTAAFGMVTNLMHFVVIVAALEPLIVVACVQSAGSFACLSCQIEVQGPAVAATQGHYFPTVDAYLIGCFVDLLTVVVVVVVAGLKDYSAVQATSAVAAYHQHYSVAQASDHVAYWLHLPETPKAVAAAAVEPISTVEPLGFAADE